MNERLHNLLHNIGQTMQLFRSATGHGQKTIAKQFGTSQGRVSAMEAGKEDIRLSTLVRWAEFYGYDVEIRFIPFEEELGET